MDEQRLTQIASEVIRELDLAEARLTVDASDTDFLRLTITEGDGDTKIADVNITGNYGSTLDENELRQRIRQHVATFAAVNVAS